MAQCAPTLKRLSMELGGDAPFIVFEDADVDAAVRGGNSSFGWDWDTGVAASVSRACLTPPSREPRVPLPS
jgi:acyl-CoA reductase-like NAD-dependent aldehyde dehydrogenase